MYEMRRFLAADHQARLLAEADARRIARALAGRPALLPGASTRRAARVSGSVASVSEGARCLRPRPGARAARDAALPLNCGGFILREGGPTTRS